MNASSSTNHKNIIGNPSLVKSLGKIGLILGGLISTVYVILVSDDNSIFLNFKEGLIVLFFMIGSGIFGAVVGYILDKKQYLKNRTR